MDLQQSSMDIEMQTVRTNGDHGPGYERAGNGESVTCTDPVATETDVLLGVQTDSPNGEIIHSGAAAPHRNRGETSGEVNGSNGQMLLSVDNAESQRAPGEASQEVMRIKRELNEIIFCKVRLWMVIIFIFLLIFAVIIIALVVCSAIHEDVDEKYDPSLFNFPLFFNGSFQLPNKVFNETQTLATDLQDKLADLYRSSPALGRYFSEVEIHAFRNGSVIADYQLKFLMPEEQQDQLKSFILSREMVFNVFRQFLYDQEPDESEPMYINPVSLIMFLRQ